MGNHTTCRPDITALPTYLKRLGYRVVLAHKAHTIPKEVFSFEYIEAGLPKNPAHPPDLSHGGPGHQGHRRSSGGARPDQDRTRLYA